MTLDIFIDADLAMRDRADDPLIPSCFYEHLELPAMRPGRGTSYCGIGAMPRTCNPSRPPFSDVVCCGDSDSLQRVDAIDFLEKAMPMCLRSNA